MAKAEQQNLNQSIISNAIESDKVKLSTFTDNGTTHIFQRYKEENGKIVHKQVTTDNMDTMSAEDLDVSGKSIGTYAPIIVRSDVTTKKIGGCASWYKAHHAAVATFETDGTIEALGAAALAGIICNLIPIVGNIFAAGCSAAATLVTRELNIGNTNTLTVGMWDNDTGFLDTPEVIFGASINYGDDYQDLVHLQTIPAVHTNLTPKLS